MNQEYESMIDELKVQCTEAFEQRENALRQTRQMIQHAAKAIRLCHRQDFEAAQATLETGNEVARVVRGALAPHPELYYAGYLQDAEKELVEAAVVLAILQRFNIPTAADLGVGPFTYLHGLGEAASEVRRTALDQMRQGQFENAERILHAMEHIYDTLASFDFPDGMSGGLRRTTDALRAVLERTRSDVTLTQLQQGLVNELRSRSHS